MYRFGDFELDADRFELRRGGALLDVQPKVLELLLHLLANRERLVSRAELLAEVWAGVHVEEASLYRAVAIARRLLREGAGSAEPIQTVQGRGYRFAAPVTCHEAGEPERARAPALPGRAAALESLAQALARARGGARQLVVVSGEAGIGKSRLLEEFAAGLRRAGDVETTLGQCLEPLGVEPYSPLLEAVGRLCRGAGSEGASILRSRAPSWIAQLPAFGSETERRQLERRSRGASRERLIEELADALEEIAAKRPLVLLLEDLHWCDRATLALLAALAQRPEPAALLVLASVRTGEPGAADAPLWKLLGELKGRQRCVEIALAGLGEADVAEVVGERLGSEVPAPLVRWLAERSAGNPLFLHHLIDFAAERRPAAGWGEAALVGEASELPGSLRTLIELQVDSLAPEARALLEAASAAGSEFSAAEVAAATGADLAEAEEACDELARRQILLARAGVSEWPDGTLAGGFRFRHGLQRDVLYARIPPARRRELHLRIAQRLEQGHAERTVELAPLLARHFAQGGDAARALGYYRAAIEATARRHAGDEARALAERALELLPRLPEAERDAAELGVRFALAPVLPVALGYGDPAVDANLGRALDLCDRIQDRERRLALLWSRCYARYNAGQAEEALALAQRVLEASQQLASPAFEVLAHDALAFSHAKLCRFAESQQHADRVLALYDAGRDAELVEWIGQDVGVDAAITSAFNLWYLGRLAAAAARLDEAIARARRSGHGYSLSLALCYAAAFHLAAEDRARARQAAEQAIACAREERVVGHRVFGELMRAATEPAPQQRLAAMVAALRDAPPGDPVRATGTSGVRALFVGALAECGLRDLALGQLAEAFDAAVQSGEHHHVPGLHVLRADLLEGDADRERELETALASAAQLGLRTAGLDAATALARLRARSGRLADARKLLAPHVAAFEGEPGVPLLQRARALLAEL